tara:strand:+ start:1072 stop:1749 length:678 start_codon:yes stop_codon:yes gene_type:complete
VNNQQNHVPHPRDFSARTNVLHYTYFRISEADYCKCLELKATDVSKLGEEEASNLGNSIHELAIKAIIFSAMSVEAAINDYAGKQLGDKYFQQHLASLDLVSKWVIIPRLVCGNSIDKSGAAYNSLKILVSARNKLVHNKSQEMDSTNPHALIEKLEQSDKVFERDFYNSLKTLYLLSMEMDYVVGHMHNPMGTLNPNFKHTLNIPTIAKDLFNSCKETVLKKYS